MGRLFAIDYGLKRCGIAVSDPLQIIATGLTTVATHELEQFIGNYVAQETVVAFVVGEAVNFDGSPTHTTQPANNFVKRLQKKFPQIPVHRVDEAFSSRRAMQSLIQGGVKKKKRRNKALLDEVSATIILQDYMNTI